jgi:hypothetical protein
MRKAEADKNGEVRVVSHRREPGHDKNNNSNKAGKGRRDKPRRRAEQKKKTG